MDLLIKHFSKKWWLRITLLIVAVFLGIGFLASTLVEVYGNAYYLTALFGLLGLFISVLLMLVVDRQTDKIKKRVEDVEAELRSSVAINRLVDSRLPLNMGGWSITAHFLERMVREIYLRKPGLILECGSGTSTIVSAYCLEDIGEGQVLSLDHLEEYAHQTRNLLKLEDLDHRAEIVTAPLTRYNLEGESYLWYGEEYKEPLSQPIDMLIVDGPPAELQEYSRYPAIPLLKESFSENAIIMLDDCHRDEERETARNWSRILDADLELNHEYKGYALLRL